MWWLARGVVRKVSMGRSRCRVTWVRHMEGLSVFSMRRPEDAPGSTPATCGNYLLHDLPMAKWEARRYVARLKDEFCCQYPGIERPEVCGGLQFHDA